jgi:ATP-binding cassette subfamily C protein LapB
MQPRLRKIADDSLQDSHDKHSILVEALSGLETLKMLGAGGILRRRFRNILIKQSKIQEESKRYSFVVGNITQEVQQVVQIAVVAVGAVLVSDGEFGFGAIIACTILSGKAVAPFAQLTQLMNRLNQVMSGYRALDELIKAPSEHSDEKHYVPRGRYLGKVTFDAVNFSYPEQEQPTLSDVSFEIKEGQRVGIVGRVGSGKTTIGKLITKLFLPSSGRVALDGVDIRQLDPAEVRENLGTVSQEPWLIAGTIQQNILLGSSSATNQDLLIAAKVAGVSDFTDKHPEGLNMQISERGEGLSGGQKQAIAIARALVRKPPVYLFDEPTSSMDARSERLFIERFKKYSENAQATTIIITHRTSLLSLVDMVMVIDEGKVIKFCPVSEFIKKKPPVKQSQNAQ